MKRYKIELRRMKHKTGINIFLVDLIKEKEIVFMVYEHEFKEKVIPMLEDSLNKLNEA